MNFTDKEIEILLKTTPDALIKDFIPEIKAIVKKFNESGQSGGSAPFYAATISETIKKLCLKEPITPISGIDEEWNNVTDINDGEEMYQNCRCSALFKHGKNSNPYYIDAIVFQGENEYDTFTGSVEDISSLQFIKDFPFTPKTFYIKVYREEYDEKKHGKNAEVISCSDGDFVYKIKDRKQLDEVYKYYDKEGNWMKKQRSKKIKNLDK